LVGTCFYLNVLRLSGLLTAADGNAALLSLLRLRQCDCQNAVLELSLGSIGLRCRGQSNQSFERAKSLLADEPALALATLLTLLEPLTPDPNGVAVDGDLDIIGRAIAASRREDGNRWDCPATETEGLNCCNRLFLWILRQPIQFEWRGVLPVCDSQRRISPRCGGRGF
jgi:hypothetical protein